MPSLLTSPNLKHTIMLAIVFMTAGAVSAEVCTTQSQMKPAERDVIANTVRNLASLVQADDPGALRKLTLPEYTKDFSGMASLVGTISPKLKGAPLLVEQVYLLDASSLKTLADGTNQDAQFFCTLNKSMAEANFLIPSLPPGRYAFAMIDARSDKSPERLSFLLKQNSVPDNSWLMAGFYPKPLTSAGHDGMWYWIQARDFVKNKQVWTGYLYYQQAQALLQPAGFVTSSHLDKLHREATAAAPPALSEGISADTPLVVRGLAGNEFSFTSLTADDSFGADKTDIVVHLAPEIAPEQSPNATPPKSGPAKQGSSPAPSPQDRNAAAMTALLAAYPELRNNFHGVWIFADVPGKTPFVTEQPMANIH